jgi:WS/DGAT/MGAT family acyltransferase
VNDVVLATVAGAVSRFLEQRGIPLRRQRELDFRAFCPVSVRSDDERGALGNRVSSIVARLPIAERDPGRRLAAVREVTGNLKQSKQALGAEVLTSVSEWTAPTLAALAARLAFRNRVSNLVVTNVPGPQIPLYLLGARMLEACPMVPLFESQGLGIALFSYAGGLFFGLNADWDQFPDLHDLVVALDRSFRELCEEADRAG